MEPDFNEDGAMDDLDMTIQPKRNRGGGAWFAASAAIVVLLAGVGFDMDQNAEQEQPSVGTTQSGLTQTEFEALRKQAELEKKRANETLEQYNAVVNELKETKSELNILREKMELEKKRANEALTKYNALVNELNETKTALNVLFEERDQERKRAENEALAKYDTAANELREALTELGDLSEKMDLEKKRADEAFEKYHAAEGELETTKPELELLREQARLDRARADEAFEKYHAAEMELVETRSQLTSTQTQLNGMVRVLSDVNNEFAKAKNESVQVRQSLAATEEKLIASQEKVDQTKRLVEEKDRQIAETHQDLVESRREADELKRQLSNDVLNSYNASALELSFHLVNDRLFNHITIDKSFFLPAVKIGGRNWIVSAFRDTTGLNIYSGYTRVTELKYKVRRPQIKDSWANITGPALCLAEDARVCMFPVPGNDSVPMEILTYEKLRERGIDNLTLFKSGIFSKASADITGRCSLSLDADDNHLYIRNPNRTSTELKAEVGDFVISKEGAFVGIVVKVGSTDLSQASTAICYVFTDEPDLSRALPLNLSTTSSQGYSEFVNTHETLRKLVEQLDK